MRIGPYESYPIPATPGPGAFELRQVVGVAVHAGYDSNTLQNDIALLLLDRPSLRAPVNLTAGAAGRRRCGSSPHARPARCRASCACQPWADRCRAPLVHPARPLAGPAFTQQRAPVGARMLAIGWGQTNIEDELGGSRIVAFPLVLQQVRCVALRAPAPASSHPACRQPCSGPARAPPLLVPTPHPTARPARSCG